MRQEFREGLAGPERLLLSPGDTDSTGDTTQLPRDAKGVGEKKSQNTQPVPALSMLGRWQSLLGSSTKASKRAAAPAWKGGVVSLTERDTVSSFLFLFWVLLAKQRDVYTSGYYICQNNYSMTNGSST